MKHWLTHCHAGDHGTTGQCSSVPSSVTAVIIESVQSAGRGGDERQPATSHQHPAPIHPSAKYQKENCKQFLFLQIHHDIAASSQQKSFNFVSL